MMNDHNNINNNNMKPVSNSTQSPTMSQRSNEMKTKEYIGGNPLTTANISSIYANKMHSYSWVCLNI